jgi:hypothetical protein
MKKTTTIIVVLALVSVGYIVYQKYFSSPSDNSNEILDELKRLNEEAIEYYNKKDFANAKKMANDAIDQIKSYLKGVNNSSLELKLNGLKTNFDSIIIASNK